MSLTAEQLKEMRSKLEEARAVIKQLEWEHKPDIHGGESWCRMCGAMRYYGHFPGCSMSRVLGTEEEEK